MRVLACALVLAGVSLVATAGVAWGDSLSLVKRLNPTAVSSYPADLTGLGTNLFFDATDNSGARALWRSDGTSAGTQEISTGANPDVSQVAALNGALYFTEHGATELWTSDGTTAGDRKLLTVQSSYIGNLTAVGGLVYFSNAGDLWRTDGTAAGTELVKANATDPIGNFAVLNGTLYFLAGAGLAGDQLWKSDGTSAGTVEVTALNDVVESSLFGFGGKIYLVAAPYRNQGPSTLFASDGTAAGTVAVKTLSTSDRIDTQFTAVGGEMFLTSVTYWGFADRTTWESDGTAAGTLPVDGPDGQPLMSQGGPTVVFNGSLFFNADGDGYGGSLWRTDGTTAGTAMVRVLSTADNLAVMGGALYFSVGDTLYRSDGTVNGAVPLATVQSDNSRPYPFSNFTAVNGTLYFDAYDTAHGNELWASDGTPAGTRLVKDLASDGIGSHPFDLTPVGGQMYFIANGAQLYLTDGTPNGTVAAYGPGSPTTSFFGDIVGVGGKAYVGSSDGLQAFSGPAGSAVFGGTVSALTVAGDRLLFPAGGAGSSWPLFASDGTAAGTQTIATLPEDGPCNIEGNPPFCRGPSGFADVCGTAYFYGADPTDGSAPYGATDLWKSDGTSAGTARVKGIPGVTHGRSAIVEMGGAAYFTVDDTSGNRVLWSSDGTDAGTVPIATVNAGGSNPPSADLTVAGQTLFFVAGDGAGGVGLWRSDGSADGTSLVAAGLDPTDLTASGGTLYFAGTDPTNGTELWRSDGTPGGTELVKDINQGAGGSNPSSITDVGGTVYFAADDGVHGSELWSSDGTPGGTKLIGDINPGSAGSDPANLTVDGSNLYFAADDGVDGTELWKDQLAHDVSPPASDCPPPPPGASTPPPSGTSTPLPAASGSGPSTSPSAPRPTLRHAHLRRRSFSARAGTSLTITLSRPMTLTISVGQHMPGRMIGHRCSTRVLRGHRCTIWRTRANHRLRGRSGRNVLRFQFRGLAPGKYTATLVGSSPAGQTSTVRLSFTITKSR